MFVAMFQHQISDTKWMSYNPIQFWHQLPNIRVRLRFRTEPFTGVPPIQMPAASFGCHQNTHTSGWPPTNSGRTSHNILRFDN